MKFNDFSARKTDDQEFGEEVEFCCDNCGQTKPIEEKVTFRYPDPDTDQCEECVNAGYEDYWRPRKVGA
jgi:hypothetical protein